MGKMSTLILLAGFLAGCASAPTSMPVSTDLLSVPRTPKSEWIKFERVPAKVCGELVNGVPKINKCEP